MNKLKMQTQNMCASNVEKIAALFPHCVTEVVRPVGVDADGRPRHAATLRIDWDKLRAELGDELIEDGEERYQFTWPDKRAASRLANEPTTMTLRPCREKSVDFDKTENLYIEGDNLDVLKVLRETYLGKVKMIYIDPPYNTGNDFVYSDNFAVSSEEWRRAAACRDYDEDGNQTVDPMVRNTEANGRFHTDWLNMIYPRMKVARDLLSNDGIIFISLDDSETFNMKKLADEIFGAENFICNFIRKNKAGSGHDSSSIAIEFDYILCYAKNANECVINQEPIDIDNDDKYKLIDEYVDRRGKYYLRDLDYRGSYSESGDYPITTPDGTIIYSGGQFGKPNTWRWSKSKFDWGVKNGYIVFKKSNTGNWKVYIKQYQFVDNCDKPYERSIPYRALIDFNNGLGSIECNNILGSNVFSYPKPSELVKHLLKIGSNKNSLILDFFSGSASTAHAVMKLNAEDGGHRKFIMVQLPEVTDEKSEARKAGYENICEIGEERIRRAGKKILEEVKKVRSENGVVSSAEENNLFSDNKNSSLQTSNSSLPDVGFRVLKLDSSNMEDVYYTPDNFDPNSFDSLIDNIKADRTGEDLLFQVMLSLGIELSAKIERKQIAGKEVFSVDNDYLLACFDNEVNETTIEEMAKLLPTHLVIRDASAANDNVLDNFDQIIQSYSSEQKITTHIL